jgi:hypothetical protein
VTPEHVARVRELTAAGQSDATIARELGVSWRTVFRARQAHNIPTTYTPPEAAHGGTRKYRRGCRCGICRKGHAERQAAGKTRRNARLAAGEAGFVHGASAYGNWGCRCPVCSSEHRARMAAYKSSRRPTR